ncbi:hypothetical protein [Roseibium alexandrii]|uniref:hypothetical protein n=1 Tax=Roseibium alexandrii TaxID=388408 RepID=UPI00375267D6
MTLGRQDCFQHEGEFTGAFTNFNHVTRTQFASREVDAPAVDLDVSVIEDLIRNESGRHGPVL